MQTPLFDTIIPASNFLMIRGFLLSAGPMAGVSVFSVKKGRKIE